MGRVIHGKVLMKGVASGPLLVGNVPLSFWGGYSQFTGEIIDRRHPLSGMVAAGCILAIPASRGSSTTTAVLLEAVRRGTAPAALITSETDTFLVLASVVADELYQKPIPVLSIQAEEFEILEHGQHAELTMDGSLRITDPA
ncbi:MAG: DUF126 domain-containing protein [Rhodothermaceae bacterium]|nr:DUF126 domain-containing protein [Rhodothermaceae bacterium]MXX58291.1 DUF126 domain-containing protein [Rhodothermaceae bacterium]MYD18229.1 DUF126 domain-containing protein [Rhodothermaceae bacterium]MYD57920.1 DUF126 domain-containing protein [Rhodothermaceae bacterium]MYI44601.1 DUF126 domain-containing protein [Rhodothermaceae bacterium]